MKTEDHPRRRAEGRRGSASNTWVTLDDGGKPVVEFRLLRTKRTKVRDEDRWYPEGTIDEPKKRQTSQRLPDDVALGRKAVLRQGLEIEDTVSDVDTSARARAMDDELQELIDEFGEEKALEIFDNPEANTPTAKDRLYQNYDRRRNVRRGTQRDKSRKGDGGIASRKAAKARYIARRGTPAQVARAFRLGHHQELNIEGRVAAMLANTKRGRDYVAWSMAKRGRGVEVRELISRATYEEMQEVGNRLGLWNMGIGSGGKGVRFVTRPAKLATACCGWASTSDRR